MSITEAEVRRRQGGAFNPSIVEIERDIARQEKLLEQMRARLAQEKLNAFIARGSQR